MARLYPMLLFALLVLVVPVESEGQFAGNLAKLTEVAIIIEDLNSEAKQLGLSKDNTRNHVLLFLRTKLPRLKVKDKTTAFIYVNIILNFLKTTRSEKSGFYGTVIVHVARHATISKTKMKVFATVWESAGTLSGPTRNANRKFKKVLDLSLTKFTANWYRDNP